MMHRTLVALLVVPCLALAGPAQAAPSPTRAAGATSGAAVYPAGESEAWYAKYARFLSLLEYHREVLKLHDKSYGGMLMNYVFACPTAKHMEAVDPPAGQTMWRDISKAAKIDLDFDSHTLLRSIDVLFDRTDLDGPDYKSFLDFFDAYDDKGLTFAHGMLSVHTGAELWTFADLEAQNGLDGLLTNPSANCDKAISDLTTAAGEVFVEAEKSLDKGFEQLESLNLAK
jgi:hypothetical protein